MNKSDCLNFDVKRIESFLTKCEDEEFKFTNYGRKSYGIVHFTSGSAELSVVGHGKYTLRAGDTAVFARGDKYTFYAKDKCSYVTSGYFFTEESEELIASLPKVIHSNSFLCDKIEYIAATWQKQLPDRYMICKIQLLSLYLEFFKITGKFSDSHLGGDIERAIKFIHDNYKRNFSSEEIAEYCNLSCSYLRASFKEKVGMTIVEYRDNLRFTSAKEFLLSGQFSIKETAENLGFCDVYYFSKFFHRHSGTTPSKFAKNKTVS